VSRAVVGGWSRFPEELATARGQIGGFLTGAGAGFAIAGEHGTATVIALLVMVVGFVLTMRAWAQAEAHRDNYRAAPSDGGDPSSAAPHAPTESADS
jgi:uncharacterized membrane protein